MKIKAWCTFDTKTITKNFYFDDSIDSESSIVKNTVKRWADGLIRFNYVEVKDENYIEDYD